MEWFHGAAACFDDVRLAFSLFLFFFFFQAEDGIRDADVTGVQTCALPISPSSSASRREILSPSPVPPYWREMAVLPWARSEERRVGKECRSRGSPDH